MKSIVCRFFLCLIVSITPKYITSMAPALRPVQPFKITGTKTLADLYKEIVALPTDKKNITIKLNQELDSIKNKGLSSADSEKFENIVSRLLNLHRDNPKHIKVCKHEIWRLIHSDKNRGQVQIADSLIRPINMLFSGHNKNEDRFIEFVNKHVKARNEMEYPLSMYIKETLSQFRNPETLIAYASIIAGGILFDTGIQLIMDFCLGDQLQKNITQQLVERELLPIQLLATIAQTPQEQEQIQQMIDKISN